MIADLKELWRFRELLYSMVERELKIRYKNSFLGFFWSLLNPLITVLVMTVVFKYFLSNSTPNFSAYILAAYLPYMFLQLSLLDSAQSVLAALPIVKKVYFPREILPLSGVISNFIHFLLAQGVFLIYLLFVFLRNPGENPFQVTLLFLPALWVIQLMLCVGLGLLISALNTLYEDVKYIVSVLLYLLFFLCPIMYFSENVWHRAQASGSWVYTAYHLNPVAMLSTAYRKVLVAPQPVDVNGEKVAALPLDWGLLAVAAAIAFLCLIGGYSVFNRLKWRFVERP